MSYSFCFRKSQDLQQTNGNGTLARWMDGKDGNDGIDFLLLLRMFK